MRWNFQQMTGPRIFALHGPHSSIPPPRTHAQNRQHKLTSRVPAAADNMDRTCRSQGPCLLFRGLSWQPPPQKPPHPATTHPIPALHHMPTQRQATQSQPAMVKITEDGLVLTLDSDDDEVCTVEGGWNSTGRGGLAGHMTLL